jgi:hypothetical protein
MSNGSFSQRASLFSALSPGSPSQLLRMRELSLEQACWVLHPVHAWGTIASKASAGLVHRNAYESSHVDGRQLAGFMDAVLNTVWRHAPVLDGTIRQNMLDSLEHEIRAGRWIVLGWVGVPLVDWVEDPDAPDAPDGGRWQVNRHGRWSTIGEALQWRLDEAYREQEMRLARTESPLQMPLRKLAAEAQRKREAEPVAMKVSTKAAALIKTQRWQGRQTLIAAGLADPSKSVNAAAQRLARNNVAVEKARFSEHVYEPTKAVPEGWRNASGDLDLLEHHEIDPLHLEIKGTTFRAQFYEPNSNVFGNDMKPTLAFKGTEMKSLADWKNNGAQGFNMESPYYKQAVKIGKKLRENPFPIDITGHSQGGGLCAAASSASGKDCWSFNAAGLHPETVKRYGGTPQPSEIHAYYVKGEALTILQSVFPLPEAAGTPYALDGKGSPVSKHFIRQVIDGIEKQKQEDISILQSTSI